VSESFVTILRSTDPLELEQLQDLLEQEGIACRVFGTQHGAGIGVAQHILNMRLEVAECDQVRAQELVEQFSRQNQGDETPPEEEELKPEPEEVASTGDAPLAGDGAEEGAESGTRSLPRRLRPIFAAALVLFLPGACHLYARRLWTALSIGIGEVVALFTLFGYPNWTTYVTALLALGGCLLFDLIGAQLAVRAYNAGQRPGRGKQALTGLVGVGLIAALSFLLGPWIPWTAPENETDPLLELLQEQPPQGTEDLLPPFLE
jgi:hypothetical protein